MPPPPGMPPAAAAAKPKTALDKVADLQRKLNRKMLKRSKNEEGGSGGGSKGGNVDLKLAQWVALQARTRKMTEDEFTELYTQKQSEVGALLDEVVAFEGDVAAEEEGVAMASLCSRVSDASGWFPGGYKEIKAKYEGKWCKVERKVEGMLLLGSMVCDMSALVNGGEISRLEGNDLSLGGATVVMCKSREAIEGYRKRWGNAEDAKRNFEELGLCLDVEMMQLAIARIHGVASHPAHAISDLVKALVDANVKKIAAGDVLALRDATRTCMSLALDTVEWFPHQKAGREETLPAAQGLVNAHIMLVLIQFEAGLEGLGRREVSNVVEGVLKMLSLLEKTSAQVNPVKVGSFHRPGFHHNDLLPLFDYTSLSMYLSNYLTLPFLPFTLAFCPPHSNPA